MVSSPVDNRGRACQLGYLHRADGSCLYNLGGTVVLVSVNGPGDLRASKQLAEKALIETYFHTKVGGSMISANENATGARKLQRYLQSICESYVMTRKFPRTTIVITIQEMHDDGCLLSSAINATCLALLDAGLPMKSVFAAITCILSSGKDGKDGILQIEPDLKQERGENVKARMVFVFESDGDVEVSGKEDQKKTIGFCSVEGVVSEEQLKTARELARETAEDVFRLYRSIMEKRFSERKELEDGRILAAVEK